MYNNIFVNDNMLALSIVLLFVLPFLLFFLLRFFFLWYFKIDKIVKILEEISQNLKDIKTK